MAYLIGAASVYHASLLEASTTEAVIQRGILLQRYRRVAATRRLEVRALRRSS